MNTVSETLAWKMANSIISQAQYANASVIEASSFSDENANEQEVRAATINYLRGYGYNGTVYVSLSKWSYSKSRGTAFVAKYYPGGCYC